MFSGSGLTKSGTGGISGTLGGTGFGSATSGSSGGLGGALGAATGGRGGAGGATGFGATGATGMGAANSGFVGRTNTAMAGNSRAGQTGGNTTRQAGRANSGGNNFQSQNQPQANSMTRSSSIRPRQRLGFDVTPRPAERIVSTVSTRIDKIALKKPALKLVNVELKGDEIVLSGKVKSINDSKLAENLLRLEPGVRTIRNELEIEQVPVVE
jgi:osmotically-inducible protein OsmY